MIPGLCARPALLKLFAPSRTRGTSTPAARSGPRGILRCTQDDSCWRLISPEDSAPKIYRNLALLPVQSGERAQKRELTCWFCFFSTNFSTNMLKTRDRHHSLRQIIKPPRKAAPKNSTLTLTFSIRPLLPAPCRRCQSSNTRFARRRDLRKLPSTGSWWKPATLPA